MNKIIITGRLVRDPELRKNESGSVNSKFTVAVQRPMAKEDKQQTDFLICSVWGKQAENLCKYQSKGSLVAVEGEMRADNYTDEEGNTKTFTYIYANRIEYLGGKKEEETKEEVESESDPFEDFSNEVELTDEDLPF